MIIHRHLGPIGLVGLLLVGFAFAPGCDTPPDQPVPPPDSEGDGPGGVEIESTSQQHTSSTDIKTWKLQPRTYDLLITGKSSDGKLRFRGRVLVANSNNLMLVVTKPTTTIITITNNENFVAGSPDVQTKKYIAQLNQDFLNHKHGLDGSCLTSSFSCALAVTKVGLDVLTGNPAAPIDSAQASFACSQANDACGWWQTMMQVIGEAVQQCMDIQTEYGVNIDCTGSGGGF
jgi:hypothetical protein